VEVKTDLVKNEVPVDEPLLKTDGNDHGAQTSATNPPSSSPQR
jgi:hypothetical protein